MGLLTTTIGAFPKPDYVNITDWFKLGMDTPDPTGDYAAELDRLGKEAEDIFGRGTREAMVLVSCDFKNCNFLSQFFVLSLNG